MKTTYNPSDRWILIRLAGFVLFMTILALALWR